jgi:nucleotidyltransferase/DNA polymerase involved in DNA repair
MKKGLFSFACLLLLTQLSAQTPASVTTSDAKMDELIAALESTPFIKNFKEYRSETEAKILELKLDTQLNPKDVGKVKIAYRQSQLKFDAIVDQLKRDLASNTTRKLIKKSPDVFAAGYQLKLDDAKLYCNNNFHQKADLLLKKDAMDSETIKLLIDTFFSLFKSFTDRNKTDNAFNAAYLDAKFIEPLRFKTWEKVE